MATPSSTFKLPDGMTPEQAFRYGIASLLEQTLHATGHYNGFSYQNTEYRPDFDRTAHDTPLREGYDDTRRRYNSPRTK